MAVRTRHSKPARSTKGKTSRPRAADSKGGAVTAVDSVDHRLVDNLVEAIQERISSGELPVGTWLRQEKLATEFGVSRMPVREALRQLQAMGAVEIIANRGARVRLPSQRDVMEIYELHSLLLGQAAASAAQLITAEQLARLRDASELFYGIVADLQKEQRGSSVNFGPRWYRANVDFYNVIIEASDNRNLALMVDRLHHLIPRNLTWLALRNDSRRIARDADDHQAILAAIDEGDSDKARSLVMKRTKRSADMVSRVLSAADRTSRPNDEAD